MDPLFERSLPLFGISGVRRLSESHVAVFGVGGVGGAVVEALARAGVGELTLIDGDRFAPSNLNRQLLCTRDTVGKEKAAIAAERCLAIAPQMRVHPVARFYKRTDPIDLSGFTMIADCIDDTDAKVFLIEEAQRARIPLISSMGAAGRLDPAQFRLGTLYRSFGCPLAKKMRSLCRAKGLDDVAVVFSPEAPRGLSGDVLPSVSFVPPAAGNVLAGAIIRTLCDLT